MSIANDDFDDITADTTIEVVLKCISRLEETVRNGADRSRSVRQSAVNIFFCFFGIINIII